MMQEKVFHMDLVNALISDDKSIRTGGLPPVTGVEMVTNGDFSASSIGWHYGVWVSSPYRADFRGVNQEFVVDVQTAGDEWRFS